MTSLDQEDASGNMLAGYEWAYNAAAQVTDQYSYADTASGAVAGTYTTWAHAQYNYDGDGQLATTTSGETTTHAVQYSNWANAPGSTTTNPTSGQEDYNYDANGNQTSNNQVSGSDNELQSDGTYTYGYDPDGNCTSRTQIALTASSQFYTLYTWDNRNRLTEVTYENKSSQITSTVQYTYDVENRWIGETVTTYTTPGNLSAGTTTQQEFVYDGNQIVLQFSNTSSFTTGQGTLSPLTGSDLSERYLWGPAVDQLLRKRCRSQRREGKRR